MTDDGMGGGGSKKSVCIIGTGPAGIAVANELAERGFLVTLVESGVRQSCDFAQSLSDAVMGVHGAHSPMEDAVARRFGGTGHLWGGRCVPYDPIDFEARLDVGVAGWPFDGEALAPYWAKACSYADCGTGSFVAGHDWRPLVEGLNDGLIRSDQLERWSAEPVISRRFGAKLMRHPRVTVLLGWTAVGFECSSPEVVGKVLLRRTQISSDFRAIPVEQVVVACGGVESTRLLLNAVTAGQVDVKGVKHLGIGYMGHLSGKIASIQFNGDPKKTDYGFRRSDGYYCRRRFTLDPELMRSNRLLNIAMWLDNPPIADPSHRTGVLSTAYLALLAPISGSLLAPPAIRKAVVAEGYSRKTVMRHIRNVIGELPSSAAFSAGFAWHRYVSKPRIPGFFVKSRSNRYALHFHAEQSRNIDSTIRLSDETDALGMRKALVSLRYSQRDADSVVRAHALLDAHLQSQKVGRLIYWHAERDRREAVLAQARDGFHQLGVARMGRDASEGVVDENGCVFGVKNLYVCSTAVFPTSGQANPTLTLLAFAMKQADHLAKLN